MRNYVVEGNTVNGGAAIEAVAQPGVATESISFTGVPTLGTGQTVKLVWTAVENNRMWTREETLLPVGSAYVLNITNEMESLVGYSIGARLRVEFAYAAWLSGPFTISILPETHITTLAELTDEVHTARGESASLSARLTANDGVVSGLVTDLGTAEETIADHGDSIEALSFPPIVTVDESTTLAITDANTILSAADAVTITIPLEADVSFAIGTRITIISYTESDVAIAPATGVTLNSASGNRKINGQYAAATLMKTSTNEWILYGSLKA